MAWLFWFSSTFHLLYHNSVERTGKDRVQKPTYFPEVDADSAAAEVQGHTSPTKHEHPFSASSSRGQDEISRWCCTLSDAATTLHKAWGMDTGARLPGKALTDNHWLWGKFLAL